MTITINGDAVLDENPGVDVGVADDDLAWATFHTKLTSSLYDHLFGSGGSNLGLPSSGAAFPQVAWQDGLISLSQDVDNLALAKDNVTGASFDGVDSGLTDVAGHKIFFYGDSNDHVVLGRVSASGVADATGAVAVAIVLDGHLLNGKVHTADLYSLQFTALKHGNPAAIDAADTLNLLDKVFLASSLTTHTEFSDFTGVPSGQDNWVIIQPTGGGVTDPDILVTGLTKTDSVNVSSTGLGMNSQAVDHNEGLRFDFVNGGRTNLTNTIVHDDANIDYSSHQTGNGGGFSLTQTSPAKITVSTLVHAYNAAEDYLPSAFKDNLDHQASVQITSARVYDAAGVLQAQLTAASGSASANGITINLDGDTAKIDGLKANYRVDFNTNADMDRFTVENVTTQTNRGFDLGKIYLTQTTVGQEHPEIGSHLIYEDDGPSIIAGAILPTLTVDETDLSTDSAFSFAGVFTAAGGADGLASTAYALGVVAGDSGLVDTATKENVVLSMNGATVEGRTATSDDLVFTVSVNSSGSVTLNQLRAVVNPTAGSTAAAYDEPTTLSAANLVTLTATATDGDGDSAPATVEIGQQLVFEDDGLSISAGAILPALTVDETDLSTDATFSFASVFTAVAGADGIASTAYALSATAGNSGLVDTATKENVVLSMNGATVEGRTASSNDLAFTVSVDGSGNVTLDQLRAVVHPTAGSSAAAYDETTTLSAANLVKLTATVTDGDNDTASATANIGQSLVFHDDGPSGFTAASITVADTVQNQPGESATKDLTGDSTKVNLEHSGADGFAALSFYGSNGSALQGSIGGGPSGTLHAHGANILLSGFATSTLTAYTEQNSVAGYQAGADKAIFTITLNAGADNYTFNMLDQIDNGANALTVGFAGQKQTIYEYLTLDLPGADTHDPDGDFLFTGMIRSQYDGAIDTLPGPSAQVNVSSTGIGVASQSIGVHSGAFIDFVDNTPLTPNGQSPISALTFPTHVTYNNAGFSISQIKPNINTDTDVRVSVYDEKVSAADSAHDIVNDTAETITWIIVRAPDLTEHKFLLANDDASFTIGGRSISVDWNPANAPASNFVDVHNLGDGYTVLASTADGFQRILVENAGTGNQGFDISGVRIEQFDAGSQVSMSFNVAVSDGDLDQAFGTIGVSLTPPDFIL